MFSSISWHQFILTILVLIVLYYGYIGVGYYWKDGWYRLTTRKSPAQSPQPTAAPVASSPVSANPNPLLPVVHDLVDEVNALLQAEGHTVDKDNLLGKLRRLLQKYPTVKDTPFQASINQLIYGEIKNQCSLDLEEDDIGSLWD
jgi:hypothetical protein